MNSVFIHGFLGLPQDWSTLFKGRRIDLWKEISPREYSNLDQAGKRLSELVTGEDLTIVGYSLGGRVALHWPQDQWHRIRKMILISVHGGLTDLSDKNTRWQQDEKWAQRFLNDSWEQVVREWNEQDVFKADTVRPNRRSTDYDRATLSAALMNWSLSKQAEQFTKIKSATFSVSYCYGLEDEKFAKYAHQLQKENMSWNFCGFKAGHSLHLSHAQELAEMITGKTT